MTGPNVLPSGPPRPYSLSVATVAETLHTSPRGLASADVEARLLHFGPNRLEETPPTAALTTILHQFQSPLIYILLVAAAITTVLGDYIDAGVIAAILAMNAAIGFAQERKAESSVRALARLVTPRARVIRADREWEIESRDLVPGDVVLLESGSRVPADLRLFSTTDLRVDESLLTGESLPVHKGTEPVAPDAPLAERECMAHAGSIVTSGRGRGYVVATAGATEIGAIAGSVRETVSPETPLQARMSRFARLVGVAVGGSVAVAFAIGAARGEGLAEMFMVAVALAVAAVPEGLPVVFTITLALGVRRMSKRNAIVRRLAAVETLGSTRVIGSDKTGTLTQNRMTVVEVWAGGRTFATDGEAQGDEEAAFERGPLHRALLAGVLANEAELYRTDEGIETQGDPTEVALLLSAASMGVETADARSRWNLVREIPFESERGFSAAICERDGEHVLYLKGSPERVLAMAVDRLDDDGTKPLEEPRVRSAAEAMASRGLRVLATATRRLAGPLVSGQPLPAFEGLTFLGLHGMMDPPRPGVRDAIAGCRDAGIRVVMITGDHAVTASAIGRELDLATEGSPVVTGPDLERMDDAELDRRVATVAIYARVSPEHKLRIVQALQRNGDTVAVTGDGVNDAPALKAADIGVAMGKGGTDVAREASDMILADDNFVSIYAAVEEGRVTFDNVRKVTFFLLSTGAATIVILLASLALGWPLPMLPAQLLWLNLVTNGLQDVALAFEPGEPDVLRQPPRDRREGIISPLLWERTLLTGLVMATGTLLLFRWELDQTGSLARAQTVALTTMVLFQNFHVGNSRSTTESAFRRSLVSNPFLLAAAASALAVHTAALYWAPTQFVLRVEPIELEAWIRIVVVALSVIFVVEAHKWVRAPLRRPVTT